MISKLNKILINIKFIGKLLFKYKKRYLVILLIFCVLNSIIPFLSLLNTQNIINTLQSQGSLDSVIFYLILYVLIGFINIWCSKVYSYYTSKYQDYLYLELNQLILNKTKVFELSDYEDATIYDMMQRAEQDIGVRPFNMVNSFLSIVRGVITLVISISILILWHWWLVFPFIVLSLFAIKYFANLGIQEYQMIYNRTNYERKSWYISHLLTKDTFVKEIKMLSLSEYLLKEFYSLRNIFYNENLKMNKKKIIFSVLYTMANFIISAGIVALATIESYFGKILVGSLMTYINVASKIESSIEIIVNAFFSFYQDSLYIENIKDYLNFNHIDNSLNMISSIDDIKEIKLIDVSYKYPGVNRYALKNINLTLKVDEVVVLVGENGSGKTTLIKLLNGLYKNYEGLILVNGIDIKMIQQDVIREKVSTLFQDYNKYQFTVNDNIGFGSINDIKNTDKIIEASKKSGSSEFVMDLKNNYNQQLGSWFSGGVQLSGGEWQKLGIARLYMKGGDMYILDEPTASLDPKSEFEFFKSFRGNMKNKITLFITHRFVNATISDRIIVIDNGEIVEEGSHDKLIKTNGLYKKMYDFQNTKR